MAQQDEDAVDPSSPTSSSDQPVLEDETYHFRVDTSLERRLAAIHLGAQAPAGAAQTAAGASPEAAGTTCPSCREDLRALGLPYRIVLHCHHDDPSP